MSTYTFTREGRTFRCWTTEADAAGGSAVEGGVRPASAIWAYAVDGIEYPAFQAKDDDLTSAESRGAFEHAILEWHRAHVEHGPDDAGRPFRRWVFDGSDVRELGEDDAVTMEFAPLFLPRASTDNVVYVRRPLTEQTAMAVDQRLP